MCNVWDPCCPSYLGLDGTDHGAAQYCELQPPANTSHHPPPPPPPPLQLPTTRVYPLSLSQYNTLKSIVLHSTYHWTFHSRTSLVGVKGPEPALAKMGASLGPAGERTELDGQARPSLPKRLHWVRRYHHIGLIALSTLGDIDLVNLNSPDKMSGGEWFSNNQKVKQQCSPSTSPRLSSQSRLWVETIMTMWW